MNKEKEILIITGEPSGDQHAARYIKRAFEDKFEFDIQFIRTEGA